MTSLVLLVGSNTLPNYLTAMALQPKPERVVLVYSSQTEEPMKRLRGVLLAKGFSQIAEECVRATDAKDIYAKLIALFEKSPSDTHLNYTGGTKTMAAHARMAFKDAGLPNGDSLPEQNASYLDEGGESEDGMVRPATLRFDTNTGWELSQLDLDLSLKVLLGLHDFELGGESDCGPPLPAPEDVAALCRPVIFDEPPPKRDRKSKEPTALKLRDRLFRIHREKDPDDEWNRVAWKVGESNPADLRALIRRPDGGELPLSIDRLPAPDWTGNRDRKDSRFTRWLKFLHGAWQEEWVAELCRGELQRQKDAGEIRHFEVQVGENCFRMVNGKKQQVEIDVLIVRDHRFYAISCTTDRKQDLCKLKLFEASVRARQLGGDLARVALVSFLHGCDEKGASKTTALENEVAESWKPSHRIRVFGLDDLKDWLGRPEDGVAVDTSELAKWLKS
jgi:hypothetical protein